MKHLKTEVNTEKGKKKIDDRLELERGRDKSQEAVG